jgi:hypothetical protein
MTPKNIIYTHKLNNSFLDMYVIFNLSIDVKRYKMDITKEIQINTPYEKITIFPKFKKIGHITI